MEQRARARWGCGPSRSRRCGAEDLQPAHRPVRAGRHHVEHLLGLVLDRDYIAVYGTMIATAFLETFKEFPPRQEPATFTIDHAVDKLHEFLASKADRREGSWWSWEDGSARAAILDFVGRVTKGRPDFVAPEGRVAVFDNDGTLWCEKPLPIQLDFSCAGWPSRPPADPRLPRAAVEGRPREDLHGWVRDHQALPGRRQRPEVLLGAVKSASPAMTVEKYEARVGDSSRGRAPDARPAVPGLRYPPMVELLRYLEANGFAIYIASGGGRDFMRPVRVYGIPTERVIGSAQAGVRRGGRRRRPLSKPRSIFRRRPGEAGADLEPGRAAADPGWAGNANGDHPMLGSPGGPRCRRCGCWSCTTTPSASSTTPPARSRRSARREHWTVVSVKHDWTGVFSDQ